MLRLELVNYIYDLPPQILYFEGFTVLVQSLGFPFSMLWVHHVSYSLHSFKGLQKGLYGRRI